MPVKVYVSESCPVCQEIKDELAALARGEAEIQVISIDTDEGFDEFAREVIDKSSDGEGAIPTAWDENGEKCHIMRSSGKMAIKCGERVIGTVPEGTRG